MKLTDEIKYKLISFVRSNAYDIIVPNFFHGMWEMDIFKLLKTGYIYEYEIKISHTDFKKDFYKNCNSWTKTDDGYSKINTNKHDVIKKGLRCNRFFFVCPEGVIDINEVPDYAGLLYYKSGTFHLIKNAKLIHKNKFDKWQDLCMKLAFRDDITRSKLRSFQKNKNQKLI